METMTSENIYRIEITESNVPAQVLEKEIKTENNNDYTKTITKLKRDTGMVKKLKQLSILNRINTQKQINDAV